MTRKAKIWSIIAVCGAIALTALVGFLSFFVGEYFGAWQRSKTIFRQAVNDIAHALNSGSEPTFQVMYRNAAGNSATATIPSYLNEIVRGELLQTCSGESTPKRWPVRYHVILTTRSPETGQNDYSRTVTFFEGGTFAPIQDCRFCWSDEPCRLTGLLCESIIEKNKTKDGKSERLARHIEGIRQAATGRFAPALSRFILEIEQGPPFVPRRDPPPVTDQSGPIEYIAVDSAVSIVSKGDQTKTIRFNVLIGPEGDAAARQRFITHFSTDNRDKLLRGEVIALMNSYDFETISDVRSFRPVYERELKRKLNSTIPSSVGKVAVVTITEIRWD